MATEEKEGLVVQIEGEMSRQLATGDAVNKLLATVFKGFNEANMRAAMFEGMLRGFKFQDFLNKNVYALQYGTGYSLITSIDLARKIGMRSGVIGVGAPIYEVEQVDGKEDMSCTITVKRRVGQDIGEYMAKVYLSEFSTGKNQWLSKKRMMIAKVAEMHALRKACPEELEKLYTAEEFDKKPDGGMPETDIKATEMKLRFAKTMDELKEVWSGLTPDERRAEGAKDFLDNRKVEIEKNNKAK